MEVDSSGLTGMNARGTCRKTKHNKDEESELYFNSILVPAGYPFPRTGLGILLVHKGRMCKD